MAYDPSIDTDDSAVPAAIRRFLRKRVLELTGVTLFAGLIAVGLSLASWSVDDPSLNHALDKPASNWLGYPGAVIADELMQFFGLGVLPLIAIPMAWAVRLVGHAGVARPVRTLALWLAAAVAASGALSCLPNPSSWALAAGLGGNVGDVSSNLILTALSLGIKGFLASFLTGLSLTALALLAGKGALGLGQDVIVQRSGTAARVGRRAAGSMIAYVRDAFDSWRQRRAETKAREVN